MNTTIEIQNHNEFREKIGIRIEHDSGYVEYGYKTQHEANEFARLYCSWWGSNLVYLGAEQKNSLYFPKFNIWD